MVERQDARAKGSPTANMESKITNNDIIWIVLSEPKESLTLLPYQGYTTHANSD
ncbi:17363_t:CDS:2 [Rhizophagus irregularis]|nr:17363_t:CDS:2 [Rhizophagus irregularis]